MTHHLLGKRMPDITLRSTLGGALNVAMSAQRSVIVIYPYTGKPGVPDPENWDNIPGAHGSTPQLRGYQKQVEAFARLGVQVIGLSQITCVWQKEFMQLNNITFPLLSDANFAFANALTLNRFPTGGTDYLTRITLGVENSKITHVQYPIPHPESDWEQALAWASSR